MKNKNLREISETGGGAIAYARETTAPVTESIEADTEPAATMVVMPTPKIFDLSRQHVSRQQKAMWTFICDDVVRGGEIWFVGYGVFVVTSA
jgi:hypothetical protein